jgi:hypothetical protein
LVDARPHIGTNRLPTVITNMREHLEAAGVELLFGHRAEGLEVRGGRVAAVRLAAGERIEVPAVVVAPGHSARDVHAWVREAGALVRFKPFAMGVRVEHRQSAIDRIQFGDLAGHPVLGAASYRIVERVAGLGVFSFCMCPGGIIAPAATEPEGLVVNGWSPSSRRGRFANSGFVVEIDGPMVARMGFDASDPMVGIAVQRSFERRAFAAGGGAFVAPAQRLDDFVHSRASTDLPSTSYPRGIRCGDLGEILQPLAAPLRQALAAVSRRMPGYVGHEAVAVALESRTSCPVRIERDPTSGCAIGCDGLFPCGEGAGYAGGIMSAALDGIKIARSVAAFLSSRPHFAEPPW